MGGGRGGGTGCFFVLFVCLFVVAQHWFYAIHSQSPSQTLGQVARDYTAFFFFFHRRQVSVFTTSDLFEMAWMLQK